MIRAVTFAFILVTLAAGALVLQQTDNSTQSGGDSLANDPRIPATAEARRGLEEAYLRYAVDSALLPYAHLEIPGLDNVATTSAATGDYLLLTLLPGQPLKNNGVRAEVSIDYPYREGETVEYAWEFRLPASFPNDAPDNRWWVLADWHDQPDPTLGETWDTYEAMSAPIIFGYGYLNGSDQLGLSTGLSGSEVGIVPRGMIAVTREQWHHIRLVVHWSQRETGRVTAYFDNAIKPTFDVSGPNMLNGYQHYMKIGQYRHPGIATENSIAIKNITIKTLP